MAKKSKVVKRARGSVRAPAVAGRARRGRLDVPTTDNDNFSYAVNDLVPDDRRGTTTYLDVVQWNLEWFGAGGQHAEFSRKRLPIIIDIFEALNGDLFI